MSVGKKREKTAIIVAEYYVGASTTVAASVFIVSETGEITTVFVKPFVARLSDVCDGALRKLRENGFCVGLSDDAVLPCLTDAAGRWRISARRTALSLPHG